jgi:hypothetical protein
MTCAGPLADSWFFQAFFLLILLRGRHLQPLSFTWLVPVVVVAVIETKQKKMIKAVRLRNLDTGRNCWRGLGRPIRVDSY